MTPLDQARRAAKSGQELLSASTDVIQRRLEIVAEAARDPLKADLAELHRMGAEKAQAISQAAGEGLRGALDLGSSAAALAARETETARRALEATMAAATPFDAVSVQAAWAVGAWSRALDAGWRMAGDVLKAQTDAVEPIRAAAVANARRLRRKG